MSNIQQTYKNRAEALRFVQDWDFPFKERTFYSFCDKYELLEPDGKTIKLCNLMAALWKHYPPVPVSSDQIEADKNRTRNREKLEDRKLEAEVLAAERKGRKEDDAWIELVDHEQQMAAFAGLIEAALNQQAELKRSELIYLCGGDSSKVAKLAHGLSRLFADAFTEAVQDIERDVEFEEESTDGTESTDVED